MSDSGANGSGPEGRTACAADLATLTDTNVLLRSLDRQGRVHRAATLPQDAGSGAHPSPTALEIRSSFGVVSFALAQ